jgi:phosphate transport system substrate-binding protein
MASRDIKDKETEKWNDLAPVKIGLDGIAVIINSKNPVKKLTKQQIQGIYTGKITNWLYWQDNQLERSGWQRCSHFSD